MPMRNLMIISTTTLLLLFGTKAWAANHAGTITNFRLNSEVKDRGVCIQMAPTIPGTWACLYKGNSLYMEINSLLLASFMAKRTCKIYWSNKRYHHEISLVECY